MSRLCQLILVWPNPPPPPPRVAKWQHMLLPSKSPCLLQDFTPPPFPVILNRYLKKTAIRIFTFALGPHPVHIQVQGLNGQLYSPFYWLLTSFLVL